MTFRLRDEDRQSTFEYTLAEEFANMWSTAKDAMLKTGSNLGELIDALDKMNETFNQSMGIPADVLLGSPPTFAREVVCWSNSDAINYRTSTMLTSNMPSTLLGSLA